MANKTLTAKVDFNTKNAERKLQKLSKLINNINTAVNKKTGKSSIEKSTEKAILQQEKLKQATLKTQLAEEKLTTQKNKTALAAQRVKNATDGATNSARKLSSAYRASQSSASGLLTTVKRLASTYLGVMGLKAAIDTSDTITSSENRLNALNGNDTTLTQQTMDKIYAASQRSRSGYGDMLSNVSKSMTLAGDAFQGNVDNAIRFQEIMAKAYTVGGASAAEQASSMYQLVQALGSGVLQGDELRSVREGAPLAYKAIEEFCQGVLNTDKSLKDLASQGIITSDMVVAGIMNMEKGANNINDKFENTKMTFAQAWSQIKNTAMKAFEPVLQRFNEMLNSETGTRAINAITAALVMAANTANWLLTVFENVINWCATNWEWLRIVIVGVLMAIAIMAVYSAITMMAAFISANWPLLLIIAIIIAIISALTLLTGSFEEACGIVCGIILAAVSVIWNLFWTLVMLIIKNAISPLLNAWDTFANLFGNLFNDPIAAIVHAFEGLADTVLSILHTIAIGIDAIFGSSLASTVQGWRDGLSSKADELANKWGNGTYEEKSDISKKVDDMLNEIQTTVSWDTGSAFNTGYDFGTTAGSALSNLSNTISNALTSLDPNSLGGALGDAYDPSGADKDIADALDKISGDTGSIAGNMDLTKEDLEYLRRVADMEWKKEFTTANITVDMSNYNTINGESDLDGIVDKLADKLYEEMAVLANGVYE